MSYISRKSDAVRNRLIVKDNDDIQTHTQAIKIDSAQLTMTKNDFLANDYQSIHPKHKYRRRLETVYSQMQAMGVQHLHARTNHGFDLKAHASILALAFTNLLAN
ncbi:MAG: hypothetical protein H0X29_06645 [Parachlamydiaceae bacterium]|nr:hypothetical protein [Parachlamydiaceae bacterium]